MFIVNLFAYEKSNFVAYVAALFSSLIKPLKIKPYSSWCSILLRYESPRYARTIHQLQTADITESPSYHVVILTSSMKGWRNVLANKVCSVVSGGKMYPLTLTLVCMLCIERYLQLICLTLGAAYAYELIVAIFKPAVAHSIAFYNCIRYVYLCGMP